jgi:hypothetical protein
MACQTAPSSLPFDGAFLFQPIIADAVSVAMARRQQATGNVSDGRRLPKYTALISFRAIAANG